MNRRWYNTRKTEDTEPGEFGPDQATAAWAEVAAESNREVDKYLRSIDPTLPEHYGMPLNGVRRIVEPLRKQSKIKLSDLIKVWDILHTSDTGDIGFCDFDAALSAVGVHIINDVSFTQPKEKENGD